MNEPWNARRTVELIMTVAVVICAIVVATAAVHREFSSSASGSRQRARDLSFMSNWRDIPKYGVAMGPGYDARNSGAATSISPAPITAPVTLIEFGDLECPACRGFQLTALKKVKEKYKRQVGVVFVHYPLNIHRFAKPAAKASECANLQGRFEEFVEAVYSGQDSLGLASWSEFARHAGVPDTGQFTACVKGPQTFARIDSGVALARRLELPGTPSIVVNGWLFPSPPSAEALSRVIDEIIAGHDPRKAYQEAGTQ